MPKPMVDLHSHTNLSDGEHPPAELVRRAVLAGVTHLAVTDHDTVAGLEEAERAAAAAGLTLIAGIEISADLGGREVHILGHFLDRNAPALADYAREMEAERAQRMERMVERLRQSGYPVSMDEVRAQSGGGALGRPHLAHVLVQRGWAATFSEAFERFLLRGGIAFVPKRRIDVGEAIALIRAAGGAATTAHPGVNRIAPNELGSLRDVGLSGVEADHPDHPPSQVEHYRRVAAELGLVPTAGSDFHGARVSAKRRLGERTMALDDLERLRAMVRP